MVDLLQIKALSLENGFHMQVKRDVEDDAREFPAGPVVRTWCFY